MLSWCSASPKSFKPYESLNVEVQSLVTTHINWGLNEIIQNENPAVSNGICSAFLHGHLIWLFLYLKRGVLLSHGGEIKSSGATEVGHIIKGTQNESFIIDIL